MVPGSKGDNMGKSGELVKAIYSAFAKGDVPAVLGALDPHIQWIEAEGFPYADGNPYSGPQAVPEGVFQRLVSALENFAVPPEPFVAASDTVPAARRHRRQLPATGVARAAPMAE